MRSALAVMPRRGRADLAVGGDPHRALAPRLERDRISAHARASCVGGPRVSDRASRAPRGRRHGDSDDERSCDRRRPRFAEARRSRRFSSARCGDEPSPHQHLFAAGGDLRHGMVGVRGLTRDAPRPGDRPFGSRAVALRDAPRGDERGPDGARRHTFPVGFGCDRARTRHGLRGPRVRPPSRHSPAASPSPRRLWCSPR